MLMVKTHDTTGDAPLMVVTRQCNNRRLVERFEPGLGSGREAIYGPSYLFVTASAANLARTPGSG